MLRVYLFGQIAVDGPGCRLEVSSLPGRQGYEALRLLVIHRGRPVRGPRWPRHSGVTDGLGRGRRPLVPSSGSSGAYSRVSA